VATRTVVATALHIVACVQSTVANTQLVQRLVESLGVLSCIINKEASAELLQTVADLDLSFTQVKSLLVLRESDGLAVKDLGARLNLSLPAASRAVDQLVQRGLVGRTESAIDRRSRLVALLPAGRELLDEFTRARTSALERWAESLPADQQAALLDALLPIVERTSSS
jgi:DNA-binding MarR family transcriptional regulator